MSKTLKLKGLGNRPPYNIVAKSVASFWQHKDGNTAISLAGVSEVLGVTTAPEAIAQRLEAQGESVLFVPDGGTGFYVVARNVSMFWADKASITQIYSTGSMAAMLGDIAAPDFAAWLDKALEA